MRYKHHKPISKIYKLWRKFKLGKLQMVVLVALLLTILLLAISTVQFVRLSPAEKLVAQSKNQTQVLLAFNAFNKNVFLRHLGASNNSWLKLQTVSFVYGHIDQPNLDKAKFEQKIKDKSKVSSVLAQTENWEHQHPQSESIIELNKLKHAIKLAEACKTYARTNPANLNHAGLVKLNYQIQNDESLGTSPPDNNIRLISARLLAEHEHYQAFKDKQRWAQKSKDLKAELYTVLDTEWQNWLKDQTTELNNYEYLLSSLSTLSE